MKYLLIVLGILLLAILMAVGVAVVRTLRSPRKTVEFQYAPDPMRADEYAEKLAELLRCETESYPDRYEPEKFRRFHQKLEELFPLVHAHMERTELDGNLLYYWKGKRADKALVLMSHQDVVPAEGEWLHDPYSGDIAEGKVWGRGAADTKCSLMGFFQACEELLKEGFVPEQDVYLSSSCTEEIGGDGCPKLVAELKRRGVHPWLVCDEGGGIIEEPMKGIPGCFAMLGVIEKGIGNVRFVARSGGGHASAPPKHSPIARLAAFVNACETHTPFKKVMSPQVSGMLETMGPYAGFAYRLLFGNLWLFKPLLIAVMPSVSPQAAAMLQTTMAFTMQSGSDACNVLPQEASVSANMRFIPHQGMKKSLEVVKKKAKKYGLETEVMMAGDCCKPVSTDTEQWSLVHAVIEKTFPGLPVSPYVMTGATDARFYHEICDNCIRFAPVLYTPEQMKGMHGLNENLEIRCLPGAVDYYMNLIRDNK